MKNEVEMDGAHGEIGVASDKNRHLSARGDQRSPNGRHMGHGILMLVCCIPVLVIAVVATGFINPGFLITALACAAMMYVMMRMMPGH